MRRASVGSHSSSSPFLSLLPALHAPPRPLNLLSALGAPHARRGLETCQVTVQSTFCQPPLAPPPPPLPPPSPPPPARPWQLPGNCTSAATPCGLDGALSHLQNDDSIDGLPAILQLTEGYYTLNSTVIIDSTIRASEVRLVGSGTPVISPLHDTALFIVTAGAPPLIIHGLTLRGQVCVLGSSLEMSSCNFDGHVCPPPTRAPALASRCF